MPQQSARPTGFTALLWAFDQHQGLTSTTKLVLLCLAKYADSSGVCWPSMSTLAHAAELSDRSCQTAVQALESNGYLTVERGNGRLHPSRYTLALGRQPEARKGEAASPFEDPEKVNVLHPLAAERVKMVQRKGEGASPELTRELPRQLSLSRKLSAARPKSPKNPRRSDPPEAWHHLADRNPDGTLMIERSPAASGDQGRAIVAGAYLDIAANLVCEAAGISNPHWQRDWTPLITWLRDGLDLHGVILPAIRRVAARPSYSAPQTLAYFNPAVREGVR